MNGNIKKTPGEILRENGTILSARGEKPSSAFIVNGMSGFHKARTLVTEAPKDWGSFLQLAGLDNFEVHTRPALYESPRGLVEVPGLYHQVNSQTGESYGVCTDQRKIVLPQDFSFMADPDVVGEIEMTGGGYRYGGQFFGLYRLPNHTASINGSNLHAYVLWIGGMDCTFGGSVVIAPYRCLNLAKAGNVFQFKHNGNVETKLRHIRDSFILGIDLANDLLALSVESAKIKVDKEQALEFIVDASDGLAKWEEDKELNGSGKKIWDVYQNGLGAPEARHTAYDLFQSATHVGNHLRSSRNESRFTNAIGGGASADNARYLQALQRLMGRVAPQLIPDRLVA